MPCFFRILVNRSLTAFAVILAFSFPLQLVAETAAKSPKSPVAPNPFTALSEPEQDYYSHIFSYTMETLEPGARYAWKTHSAHGVVSAQGKFKSKSNATCRKFSESYTISGKDSSGYGYACKREGAEGWCKLKDGAMLSCALEPPQDVIGKAEETGKNLLDNNVTRTKNKVSDWLSY